MVAGSETVARPQVPHRGAVYWVDLDPTRGNAIQKTRPCVVVSSDELNAHLRTVILAPFTSYCAGPALGSLCVTPATSHFRVCV